MKNNKISQIPPYLAYYMKKDYEIKINSSKSKKQKIISNNPPMYKLIKKIQEKRKFENNFSKPKKINNYNNKDKLLKNSFINGDIINNLKLGKTLKPFIEQNIHLYKQNEKKILKNSSSSNSDIIKKNNEILNSLNNDSIKRENSFRKSAIVSYTNYELLNNPNRDSLKQINYNEIENYKAIKLLYTQKKINNKNKNYNNNNINIKNHFENINLNDEISFTDPKKNNDENKSKKTIKQIQIKKINVYPGISSIEIEKYNKNNRKNETKSRKERKKITSINNYKSNNNSNIINDNHNKKKSKKYSIRNDIKYNFSELENNSINNSYINKQNLNNDEKEIIIPITLEKKIQNEKNESFQNNITYSEAIPDEKNTNSPKTIRYNKQIYTNNYIADKFQLLFFDHENKKKKQIKNILFSFLNYNDLYNISLVNKYFYLTTLDKIYNKIIDNISNNKNLCNKLWEKIFKISKIKINEIDFNKSNEKCLNKYKDEINKDVSRTFPEEKIFEKNSENSKKLYNILITYSLINNKIGYSQGINFIAGIIYKIYKNEKISLIYLDSIITKLNFEKVFGVNNKLIDIMNIIKDLIKEFCPNFLIYMKKNEISHEMFTANWIITLFSKGYKNQQILLLIWNFIFIFGWKFIFLFIISMIMFFERKIINFDMFKFNIYMKEIFKSDAFINNYKEIINNTFNLMENKWILTDVNSIF